MDASFANVTGVETVALTGASSIVLGANATTSGIATVITGDDSTSITSTQATLAVDATLLATTKALTLLGSANYTVTSTGTIFDKVTATSSTGTLNVTFGNVGNGTNAVPFVTGNGNTTVVGGDAGDTITVTGLATASQTFTGSVASFNITAGAGAQTIATGAAASSITGGAGIDAITLGASNSAVDKVIYASTEGADVASATTALRADAGDTIANFATSSDKIQFPAVLLNRIDGVTTTAGTAFAASQALTSTSTNDQFKLFNASNALATGVASSSSPARFIFNGVDGKLYLDLLGDTTASAAATPVIAANTDDIFICTLTGVSTIALGDISIV